MNKSFLILKYFQKVDQLNIRNRRYCNLLSSLFNWLVQNDQVKNDQTTRLLHLSVPAHAQIINHQEAILAGLEEISFLLKNSTQLSFQPLINDGEKIAKNQIIAKISGASPEILTYERTILNILQRMSGIATETNRLLSPLKSLKLLNPPFIAATRKTPWGLLDKKAVAVGGGLTHRLSLSDGILIKDNHLSVIKKEYGLKTNGEAIAKAIEEAVKTPRGWPAHKDSSRGFIPRDSPEVEKSRELIEIEVETLKQAYIAAETFNRLRNPHYHLALMFDNFSPSSIKTVFRNLNNLASSIIFEASGGINEGNIQEFAQTGVDLLSLGSLTHSSRAVNLSLEF